MQKYRAWAGMVSVASALALSGAMCADVPPVMTLEAPPGLDASRWVSLEGAVNTRDLGGYETMDGRRIKWNVLYRSANLASLTEEGCEDFGALGIRTVLDLRNRLSPTPLFGGDVVCVHRQATVRLYPMLISKSGGPNDGYRLSVHEHTASYRGVFEELSRAENYPLLYHCAAGKDRSGVVTVLLLSLLGVDEATILDDYHLSLAVYDTLPTDSVLALLDEIDAAGGIETYLEGFGISAETQSRIRALLLVPAEDENAGGP